MKKFTHYVKGFTLIELLVVIAIIGILASVVLVSLQSARKKGSDARIQEEVSQVRTQLESGFNSGYPDLVGSASHIDALVSGSSGNANLVTVINDIGTQLPTPLAASGGTALSANMSVSNGFVIYSVVASAITPADYSIYSKTSQGYFCIDSGGSTKTNTAGAAIPAAPTAWQTCQ
jgi:prepilin-type N-terminal cleavage/methylation domain-containing protein